LYLPAYCHWFCSMLMGVFYLQAFELITGDFLFEPHSGQNYSRDEGVFVCACMYV